MTAFDIDYQRGVLLALLVVLNLALVGAVVTSSAPYGPYNGAWDGGSTLRTITDDAADLTLARSTMAYTAARPERAVAFVVAPQSGYSPTDRARVRQFVQRGGTLVVASDSNRTNDLLSNLGVQTRIDGGLVRDGRENYRGPSLPVATNVADTNLTEDIDSLTLNYGSVLVVPRNGTRERGSTRRQAWPGQYLVNTSGFAYIDENRNETLDDDEILRERPVAVVEPVGEGRVIVVSDGSVFTNAMLERAGNRQFLQNLARSRTRAILDYSHGYPLPPLVFALLVVRDLPLLQFGLGLAVLASIALWMRGVEIPVPALGQEESAVDSRRLDADELSALLAEQHPNWDPARVEHVTKAIIRRRGQSDGND